MAQIDDVKQRAVEASVVKTGRPKTQVSKDASPQVAIGVVAASNKRTGTVNLTNADACR